jgi:hypothetical protein
MNTLLILGSKPEPVLPPRPSYESIACANASGFSAAKYGLSTPDYTVMSAILTSGIQSGKQSLRALSGLKTDILYFFPRPIKQGNFVKEVIHYLQTIKMSSFYLKYKLKSISYEYNQFINKSHAYYDKLVKQLCDDDLQIVQQLEKKQSSTGVIALAIGIAQGRYDRYILSGFSFELTHAYAKNPEIDKRRTKISKHVDTDVAIMSYLSKKYENIYTTEVSVSERTGVPMLKKTAHR